jgi:Thermolysin metallopeptidase, alpha-helical domain/Bacterial TSP3 repeat
LIYSQQSGGINEAFSDIAGEAAELYLRGSVDWLVGADVTKAMPALRYFEDPTLDGTSIAHTKDYVFPMDVHRTSGIYNRAYFLLSHSDGWTQKKAFEAFALANQNYWVPRETFDNGACGVLEAAYDLGYDFYKVDQAFQSVGANCGSFPFVDDDGDGMDNDWESYYGLNPSDSADAAQDNDGDGLNNLQEFDAGSDPHSMDTDNDGLNDAREVNIHNTNPASNDSDNDSLGDAAEIRTHHTNPNLSDSDSDGLSDADEIYTYGTHPVVSDTDHDHLGDGFEVKYGFDPLARRGEAHQDSDGDHLKNRKEFLLGSNPLVADTDADGLNDGRELRRTKTDLLNNDTDGDRMLDGWEVSHGLNPHDVSDGSGDPDNDNLINLWESVRFTDPNNSDSDGDGLSDGDEVHIHHTEPHLADTDSDDLDDNIELNTHGTDPSNPDTDGDALSDGAEINLYESDPLNPDTDGDKMTDGWETQYGLNLTFPYDHVGDLDGDGWTNQQEFEYLTDPLGSSSKPAAPGGTPVLLSAFEAGAYFAHAPYHVPESTSIGTGRIIGFGLVKTHSFMGFMRI